MAIRSAASSECSHKYVQACANVAGSGEDSALLTDRTFVVKSIKMLKAKAVSPTPLA